MAVVEDNKYFSMKRDERNKVFMVKVQGLIEGEWAQKYMDDFADFGLQAADDGFMLVVDSSHHSLVPTEHNEDMEYLLNLYMESGFRDVIIILPVSGRLRQQANRVMEDVGFTGQVVERMSEIVM